MGIWDYRLSDHQTLIVVLLVSIVELAVIIYSQRKELHSLIFGRKK
jgi:hypothetical protein